MFTYSHLNTPINQMRACIMAQLFYKCREVGEWNQGYWFEFESN